jgi:hypothetical protein
MPTVQYLPHSPRPHSTTPRVLRFRVYDTILGHPRVGLVRCSVCHAPCALCLSLASSQTSISPNVYLFTRSTVTRVLLHALVFHHSHHLQPISLPPRARSLSCRICRRVYINGRAALRSARLSWPHSSYMSNIVVLSCIVPYVRVNL